MEPNLEWKYQQLDLKQSIEQGILIEKLRPILMEFIQRTGIAINYIEPQCISVDTVGDPLRKYELGKITVKTTRQRNIY